MKSRKINLYMPVITYSTGLLFVLSVLSAGSVSAQKNDRQKPVFNISAGLTSMYDDNILKYSDKYIDRFLNNEDEGRFHIRTYDDVVLSPELEMSASYRFIRKLNTTLTGGYRFTSYIVNNNKSRSYLYLGLRQYFTRKASIKVSWDYIPDFYVRHFRDDDWVGIYGYTPETFKPFTFTKESYGAELMNTFFKNTRAKLIFEHASYFYNSHFTEYDCNNNAWELNIRQPLIKGLKLEAGYTFTKSDAKGSDEPGESKQSSDDSDGSYEEDAYLIRVLWDLPEFQKHRHSLDVKTEFSKRYFTSEKSALLDPLHAGRVDNNLGLNVTYSIGLTKAMGIAFFYNWYSRNASSLAEENSQFVSEEKDYGQSQIGLSVTYTMKY